MNSSKQIKWGAVLSYLAIAADILSGLLYTPWMITAIGKSQYGLYTLANSVITLFLVDFGLSSATGRYLSKYNAEGDRESAEQFLGAVYKLYLLIDAAILVILTAIFFRMDRIFLNLTAGELEQFRVVYGISAVFSVVNFPFVTFNGILMAYEKFVPLKLADILYRLCNVVFTVTALLLGYGLYALVTLHAAAALLAVGFKYAVIRKTLPVRVDFRYSAKGIYREIFGFSLWTTVSGLAARLVFNITPSILGMVAGSAAIAVFGIVATIESYAYSITTAINGMFMPKISRMIASDGSEKELNRLFLRVGRFQYILNGLILVGFAAVGREFLILWIGREYLPAYWGILLVLTPGLFYNAMQIANTTMVVTNKVKLVALISVATGITNICFSFPLSKRYGAIGACASICIAYFLRAMISSFIYHRELPLNIPRFIKACYIRMSVPVVLTLAFGILMNGCIGDGSWLLFLAKAVMLAAFYGLATFFLGFEKQEKQKILNRLKKRI